MYVRETGLTFPHIKKVLSDMSENDKASKRQSE